ncbi:ABC transporter substrate-binding protein [Archangium violaceum]|uniref:ABC transporter substrate-binding protein n=1 Tax=Archangium violaceum TaxID=83451 RepID=UPI00193C50A6|nr:ABC transporter substrate-binding protein [Archangium violaceum]QRK11203.1 ABC transporter substrate-binding protein [Archangium violaceum]
MSAFRRRLGVLLTSLLLLSGAAPPVAPAPPPSAPAPRRMRVVFLDALPDNPFRRNVVGAMRAAANDLGIDFVDSVIAQWPGEMLEQVRRLVSGRERPDYLITSIHRGIGTRVLEIAEQARVPVFIINSGLRPEDEKRVGGPRELFTWWIGQMLPDDLGAGERLAWLLFEAARARGPSPDAPVRLVALEGPRRDTSAILRNEGLGLALSKWKGAELLQSVTASWLGDEARRKTFLLMRRFPEVQVVWAASDDMALGAARGIEDAGRRPGVDVLVGGIDWTPQALQAVREGTLETSLGGHFLEGAWALVLLHDHHQGLDFASERLDWRTPFHPLTRANVAAYQDVLARPDWEAFDFRAFSKAANPRLKHYDFSLQTLFAQRHGRLPGGPLDTNATPRPPPHEHEP